MAYETMTCLERLATYIFWPEYPRVSSFSLASSGFVYTGVSDQVMCPQCKLVVRDWWQIRLYPLDEHQLRSPFCPFFTESSSNIIDTHQTSSTAATSDVNATCTSSGSTMPAAKIDRANPDYDLLKYESARLSTFHDWPVSAVVQPSALARAGFFYTGEIDRTCCAFCRGALICWEPTDDPEIEHLSHFPQCLFVCQGDVGNVPLQREASPTNVAQSVAHIPNSLDFLNPQEVIPAAEKFMLRKSDKMSANIATDVGDKYRQLHSIPMCKICMENDANILFLPCRHLMSCKQCAPRIHKCAICRTHIRGRVEIFLS